MTDVTAVLTCHREGLLVGPSMRSFVEAIGHARDHGLDVESLIIFDRGDALTRRVLETAVPAGVRVIKTDLGDPGQARNHAVSLARGTFVTFLDGDDLWGDNWITAASEFARTEPAPVICHSDANIVFGGVKQVWLHIDSLAAEFDNGYLRVGNPWDAMCLAARSVLVETPFEANNLAAGFGHEDWHWNAVTLAKGIAHRPVPETMHFKRRRRGSQMAKCDENDVIAHCNELTRFLATPARQ